MPPDQRSDIGATASTTPNSTKMLIGAGTTVEIDTDNGCSLGLHSRWLDGSVESYISKWLDTRCANTASTAALRGLASHHRFVTYQGMALAPAAFGFANSSKARPVLVLMVTKNVREGSGS